MVKMVTILFAPSRHPFLLQKLVAPLVFYMGEHGVYSSGIASHPEIYFALLSGETHVALNN
jgi:hypothetical protein